MDGGYETSCTRTPSPRLEWVVGVAARSVTLAAPPAWAVWLLTQTGPFPAWLWVAAAACPAVVAACRSRRGRNERSGRPPGGIRYRDPAGD